MLHTTRGIVLNYIKYGETPIIVRVFTEAFGVQSYIVNSARTAKGRGKMALYQPLSLL
uniref:recombination protein O N-terminal domain-containing protein n=1 Tax=Roseivirga sp. TaxID=1964215 RepID=UPI0040478437